MRKISSIFLAGLVFCLIGARATQAADIAVSDAFARLSPTGSGAAFMTLHNHDSEVDRLVAVTAPAARKAELHETRMDEGVMRMRP